MIHHTFSGVVFRCAQPGLWCDVNGRWGIRFSKGPVFPFPIAWDLYDVGRHVATRSFFWDYSGYRFESEDHNRRQAR